MNSLDLITAIVNKNASATQETFEHLMGDLVAQNIDELQMEISQSIFSESAKVGEIETVKHPVGSRPKGIGWELKTAGEQSGKDHNVWQRRTQKMYDPDVEFEKALNSPTTKAVMQRMKARGDTVKEETESIDEGISRLANKFLEKALHDHAYGSSGFHTNMGHAHSEIVKHSTGAEQKHHKALADDYYRKALVDSVKEDHRISGEDMDAAREKYKQKVSDIHADVESQPKTPEHHADQAHIHRTQAKRLFRDFSPGAQRQREIHKEYETAHGAMWHKLGGKHPEVKHTYPEEDHSQRRLIKSPAKPKSVKE